MKNGLWKHAVFIATSILLASCGGGGGGAASLPVSGAKQPLVQVSTFQTASVVVGQPTFTTGSANQGGSAGPNTIQNPYGNPLVLDGRLYLPDYTNNRVLGFNTVPASNAAAADFVLGQPNLVTTSTGSGANQMTGPQTIKAANGKFFLDDYGNHRVLIWNSPPTTDQAPADVVVGQPAFGSMVSSCTGTGLWFPESIEIAGGKLIVADSKHNRVLIWNSIPAANGAPADVVLGQADFTHCEKNDDNQDGTADATPTDRTFNYPAGIWSNGVKLVIADHWNNRVLVWNTIPTSNFAPADVVLGQGDFTHFQKNDDNQNGAAESLPSARTLFDPYFIDSDGTHLFVTDSGNNRVLVWNSIPASNFAPADTVLGQGGFSYSMYNDDNQDNAFDAFPTGRTLNYPAGLCVAGTQLIVTDNSNNRFLIFDSH